MNREEYIHELREQVISLEKENKLLWIAADVSAAFANHFSTYAMVKILGNHRLDDYQYSIQILSKIRKGEQDAYKKENQDQQEQTTSVDQNTELTSLCPSDALPKGQQVTSN